MIYESLAILTSDVGRLNRMRRMLAHMPLWLFRALVGAIGWAFFLFAGDFRRTVRRNMRTVMPKLGWLQSLGMTRRYFINLVSNTMEHVNCGMLAKSGDALFEVTGLEHIDEVLKGGQGAIVVAPHLGNYFYYYWVLCRRYRCQTVYTGMGRELRPIYYGFHAETGCDGFDFDAQPADQLLARLRQHLFENGVVYLLSDFYRSAFMPTTLFNRPNRTPAGAVVLALSQEVPLLPLSGHRTRGSVHALHIDPPIHLHRKFAETEIPAATEELAGIMERTILRVPEQWFYWFNVHERWRDGRSDEARGLHGHA